MSRPVGVGSVRRDTASERHRLYLLARVVVTRHYRQPLTLAQVARALATSPRQLQRAYAQCSDSSFREDLLARRMAAAAELLLEQRAIPVRDIARLVGYRQAPHFARAFRLRYGLSPSHFREQRRPRIFASSTAAITLPSAPLCPSPEESPPQAPLPPVGVPASACPRRAPAQR
jgi:AraC-like DNA-binding protein